MTAQFSTPILFLIFNRPAETQKVFDEIKKLKPKYLYVAADGPRPSRPSDAERCAQTRKIIEQIDFDCEVKTLFRDENLGCRRAVSQAIDWFFKNVEQGILLEDDCLPSQSFFYFCEELLHKYKDDPRVMQISGSNISRGPAWEDDYFYSTVGTIWGWATWRRAWNLYDVNMALWGDPVVRDSFARGFSNKEQFKFRENINTLVYEGKIDTWDYQWTFCKLINSGLSISPKVNLVTNIGFTADATHTTQEGELSNIPRHELKFPLKANNIVIANKEYDELFYKSERSIIKAVTRRLRRMVATLTRRS